MPDEKIPVARLWAWLAVAMSAPLAHYSGGSWAALLIAGLACWGIYGLMQNNRASEPPKSSVVCVLQIIWLCVLLSQMAALTANYWPGRGSEVVVPTVMLALAAWNCCGRPSRVAGVLFWILTAMFVPVLLTGAKDVSPVWLLPENMDLSLAVVPILLLPHLALILPRQGKEERSKVGWILVFGLSLWLITAGVLSPAVAGKLDTPFRELSRSLELGAVSRFESVVSTAVTFGWFGLLSLVLECACVYGEAVRLKRKRCAWGIAAASAVLVVLHFKCQEWILAVGSVILWILQPVVKKCWKKKKTA